jgi:F0F1-type ATP synthase assembly protein I
MKDNYLAISLRVLANVTAWIAGPVIIGIFLGKWLDNKFQTEPLLLLTTIGFCFFISMYGLVKNALKEFKKIEIESELEKKLKKDNEILNKIKIENK